MNVFFFFQAEDGIRDGTVTGVQTCALPISLEEMQIDVVGVTEEPEKEIPIAEAREISTDSLQLFLKDIGKVDLLTAAQEVELAKRIERGDHAAKQEMV